MWCLAETIEGSAAEFELAPEIQEIPSEIAPFQFTRHIPTPNHEIHVTNFERIGKTFVDGS
jgi:hypothetical protein